MIGVYFGDMTLPNEIQAFKFGRSSCKTCGHHPIMHLSPGWLLTGVPEPCKGAKGEPPCECMAFVPSNAEPALELLNAK